MPLHAVKNMLQPPSVGAVRRADPERVDGGTREASAPLALEVLGRPRAWQGGVPVLLPMRQAEILLALAEHPRGLTVDQLAAHVYGDQPVTTSTVSWVSARSGAENHTKVRQTTSPAPPENASAAKR